MRKMFFLLLLAGCTAGERTTMPAESWQRTVEQQLPLLGHRNWVLIVDKAFPDQTNAGILTVNTGAAMPEVLEFVQRQLVASPHVKPIVYRDAELAYMTDSLSPGITAAEKEIATVLGPQKVNVILHDAVFGKMSAAAGTFSVLVLKTESLHPYTSVFFELDCAYWSNEKETALRRKMNP